MTLAPAAIFKIPTESPQPSRGKAASRALKLAAAPPKAARRVAGIETRAATRGDAEVIELDLGITVYPPRDKGGRWRAVWHEEWCRRGAGRRRRRTRRGSGLADAPRSGRPRVPRHGGGRGFEDLGELAAQNLAFEKHYNAAARPFDWKFTRTDLNQLLARIKQHDRHAPRPLAA